MMRCGRTQRKRLEHLRAIPLLRECTDGELRRVDGLSCELDVAPGRVLAREGQRAPGFGMVVAGHAATSVDGHVAGRLGPGSSFGAAASLGGEPQDATVTAATPMTILVASKQEFAELMTIPSVCQAVMGSPAGAASAAPPARFRVRPRRARAGRLYPQNA